MKVSVVKYRDRKHLVLRWRCPETGRLKTKSSGKTRRREAEKMAGKLEAEILEGRYRPGSKVTWGEFIEAYHDMKLNSLSEGAANSRRTALNHYKRLCNPQRLADVTTQAVTRFQAFLRAEGKRETTIASYLAELQAAFNWAEGQDMIAKAPVIEKPKRAKGVTRAMRGRPITLEELERMLAAAPKVRKLEPEKWQRLLRGLWLSGLRLGEALALSWDHEAALCVKMGGKYPKLRLWAEAHKGHRDELLPITPDFAEFLSAVPAENRCGLVFGIYSTDGVSPISTKRASRYISAIGEKARVVTNKAEGQHATAHDLRRAFGTRWAKRVMPATLKTLMRHRSIETTMSHYVERDADDVADEVWRLAGNTFGNSDPKPTPDSDSSPVTSSEVIANE